MNGTPEQVQRLMIGDITFKGCKTIGGWWLFNFIVPIDSTNKVFERFMLKKCNKPILVDNEVDKTLTLVKRYLKSVPS